MNEDIEFNKWFAKYQPMDPIASWNIIKALQSAFKAGHEAGWQDGHKDGYQQGYDESTGPNPGN
jgi:hypothetical protein